MYAKMDDCMNASMHVCTAPHTHGLQHGAHGMHEIVANCGFECHKLILRVAIAVDDLHLLHKRALPGLTRTCTHTHTHTFGDQRSKNRSQSKQVKETPQKFG